MGIVRPLSRCVALCAAVLALALAPTAAAQTDPIEEAKALADKGYASFKNGDYDEAIALFQQAEALSHSPVILSFIAQSYEALGKLIEGRLVSLLSSVDQELRPVLFVHQSVHFTRVGHSRPGCYAQNLEKVPRPRTPLYCKALRYGIVPKSNTEISGRSTPRPHPLLPVGCIY